MNRNKGFTLIELLVVVAIIALLIGLLLPALAKAQRNAKSTKDATQIAQIHKSNIIYASENDGRYMIPGLVNRQAVLDTAGPNLAGQQIPGMGPEDHGENHTAAMYSAMIAQRHFGTDIVIGPTEVNPTIVEKLDYNFDLYDPTNDTYWDPTFQKFLYVENGVCNFSYAHTAICGKRKSEQWRNTQDSDYPVFGTRGPEQGANTGEDYTKSQTLQLHGPPEEWVGNICFNDNHVETLRSFYPVSYESVASNPPTPVKDNIFASEFEETCGGQQAHGDYAGDAFLMVATSMVSIAPNPNNPGISCSFVVDRADFLNP